MTNRVIQHSAFPIPHSRRGFSLVELLTVIFIIGLLIAILVPSLSAARNATKKMTTAKALDSIKVGLEMFKNENGSDFPQTNGYPPSFAHPPITGYSFRPELGEFPFLEGNPVVTGAHWLPAMLMGVDQLGYLKRSSVPNVGTIRAEPDKWYTVDALGTGKSITDRSQLYADPGGLRTVKTRDLPGRPNKAFFPNWTENDNEPRAMQQLPVIVDAFDQPILYYAANTHGKVTNMVADLHDPNNNYDGDVQEKGPPFYFHQDNIGFTGTETQAGWDFAGNGRPHAIAKSGAAAGRAEIVADTSRETFARYILDQKVLDAMLNQRSTDIPLRASNADSYILISAGVDGRYGTADDVSNLPPRTN